MPLTLHESSTGSDTMKIRFGRPLDLCRLCRVFRYRARTDRTQRNPCMEKAVGRGLSLSLRFRNLTEPEVFIMYRLVNGVSEEDRLHIEDVLGYHFRNPALLLQAFTRSSYCNETRQIGISLESNEVPEFFGDAILGYCTAYFLYRRYVSTDKKGMHATVREGTLAAAKPMLTDKATLSARIREAELCRYLLITVGNSAQEVSDSMAEDLFEALVCAVWADCGMDMSIVLSVVERLLRPDELLLDRIHISAKNDLQEWCQRRKIPFCYETLYHTGTDDKRTYCVACVVEGIGRTEGTGTSIKKAQMAAAAAMLPLLKQHDDRNGL